jgi:hypothetical protein
MGCKQMLRTLDSEELTLQMAYDLVEAEDVASAPGHATAAVPAFPPPPPTSPGPPRPMTADRIFAKLDRFWSPSA